MHVARTLSLVVAAVLMVAAPVLAQQPAPTAAPAKVAAPEGTPDAKAAPAGTAAPSSSAAAAAPTGSAAPAATVAAPEAPPKPEMDGATYAVRLRDLQQRIDQLKEQIRRSHARLSLLSDTILSGGGSGSAAVIRLENKLSSQFKLTRAVVVLDGATQYNKTDESGGLAEQKQIPIFSGSIPPGDHTVQVLVKLRGHGYGVFSYLRGYVFEVRSTHSFTAVEGKSTRLRVLVYEKGGVTTPLEERPAVIFRTKVASGLVGAGGKPGK